MNRATGRCLSTGVHTKNGIRTGEDHAAALVRYPPPLPHRPIERFGPARPLPRRARPCSVRMFSLAAQWVSTRNVRTDAARQTLGRRRLSGDVSDSRPQGGNYPRRVARLAAQGRPAAFACDSRRKGLCLWTRTFPPARSTTPSKPKKPQRSSIRKSPACPRNSGG